MKLSKLHVVNYRGLRDVTIPLSSFVCITGENNSGKSTLLQALSLFLSGSALKPTDYFDRDAEISIEVSFADVTEADLALLAEEHRDRISGLVKERELTLVRQYGADGKGQLGYFGLTPKDPRFSADFISTVLRGKKGSGRRAQVSGRLSLSAFQNLRTTPTRPR